MHELAQIDYIVVVAYLSVVIVVCALVTRRSPDADELFLAGRSLGWGVIGLSLFASNISSTTLIGLPGAAWEHGISVANYEWMAALILLASAIFIVPTLLRNRVTTIPEQLELRFDGRMRKYLSAVTVLLSVLLDTAGSLYAGAIVLKLFFPEVSIGLSCAAIAIFAGIYTAAGGLRAVVYTDVLQAIVLLGGAVMLTFIVFGEFQYSWEAVKAAVPGDHLSLIRPLNDPALPWLGTLVGLPILGFYYWTMNQYVAQRLLGARDARAAGYGAILAAFLKLLPLFFMVLPGVMALSLLPDLDRPDSVFPTLVATYAPAGLAGLILAGLLAAIMSSVDSALNSSSTLITLDFIKPRKPGLSAHQQAIIGRWVTLILVLIAAIWAPAIDHFSGLFSYIQQGFAYVTAPLVATFLAGYFSKRVSSGAAFKGTLIGHAFSLAWFLGTQLGYLNVHFTIVAGILLLVTLITIFTLQSLSAESASAEQIRSVDQSATAAVPSQIKLISAGLALLTLVMVFVLR